jgi:16S rRNA (guanine(966)-N(2))-methyltransferase RsmD
MQGILREALFNILDKRIPGASALDLFSGSGSIGLEALSRGAATCVFMENAPSVLSIIHRNIKAADFESVSKVFRCNLLKLRSFPITGLEPYDIVFLDPPFSFHDPKTRRDLGPLIQSLENQRFLSPESLLVLQVRNKQIPPPNLGSMTLSIRREYGSVSLMFYK